MVNHRIQWVDYSKGIGIILVVLAHILLYGSEYTFINSFHMPLFFFLAGYVLDIQKYSSFRRFVLKKLQSIVIPYFWFSLFTYMYWSLLERKVSHNPVGPLQAFVNIFLSQGADGYLPHNPALWFLCCLFVVEIASYMIIKVCKGYSFIILLVVCSIVGYVISIYMPSKFPWSMDVALTGIVFFGTGFLAKGSVRVQLRPRFSCIISGCCLIAGYVLSQINDTVSVANNSYGNYFIFYSAAFFGIVSIIILMTFIKKNRILSYLGQNSLIILALHIPVKRMVMGLTVKICDIPMEQIKHSFLVSAADTFVTILILIPVIYIIRRYLPFILAQKRERSYTTDRFMTMKAR